MFANTRRRAKQETWTRAIDVRVAYEGALDAKHERVLVTWADAMVARSSSN